MSGRFTAGLIRTSESVNCGAELDASSRKSTTTFADCAQPSPVAGRLIVVVVALTVTAFAVIQRPYDNPYPKRSGWDWWFYPIEFNAPKRLPHIAADLRDVGFHVDGFASKVWVVGDGCFVAKSPDNGRTWQHVDVLNRKTNENDGIGVLAPDFPEPIPNGYPLRPRNFYDIQFVDDSGWIVGDGGTILHTVDGGLTWQRQHSNTGCILNSVCFADEDNGYVVGAANTILRTTDGGHTWEEIADPETAKANHSPTGNDTKAKVTTTPEPVCYYVCETIPENANVIVIGGSQGSAYLSHDAGTTWTTLPSDRGNTSSPEVIRDVIIRTFNPPDNEKNQTLKCF